jgi:hypothetical protein
MKPSPDPLSSLFKAAAQVRRELPAEAPFALEARVLNAWRRGEGAGGDLFTFLPLLRRGLVLACALALAALVFSLRELSPQPSEETVIIESVTEMSFLP